MNDVFESAKLGRDDVGSIGPHRVSCVVESRHEKFEDSPR